MPRRSGSTGSEKYQPPSSVRLTAPSSCDICLLVSSGITSTSGCASAVAAAAFAADTCRTYGLRRRSNSSSSVLAMMCTSVPGGLNVIAFEKTSRTSATNAPPFE